MAEVNAKDLTTKTAPASTDSMLLFGTTTNEGAKITVDNLANNILERLATKTFPNQVGGSSAATILAQLATLNSNTTFEEKTSTVSFKDALGSSSDLYVGGTLDVLVESIDTRSSGVFPLGNYGPSYTIVLGKYSSTYFSGLVFSYDWSMTFPIFFAYANGNCRVAYMAKSIRRPGIL